MPARGSLPGRILAFALTLPGAFEDHPWGESVVKVGRKIFVFLGTGDDPEMSVKLPDSNAQALMTPGAEPTGYGLGRAGWVSVPLRGRAVPFGVLTDWVEESYCSVATKTLVAELDARRRPSARLRGHTP